MPDFRRAHCRQCRRHKRDAGSISWAGLCLDCGTLNLQENLYGIMTKSGEPWRKWRHGMAACVGGVLLDELPTLDDTGRRDPRP